MARLFISFDIVAVVIVFRRDRTGGIIGGGNVPSLISFTPQMQIPGSDYH
jgi:hypothetical protein